MKELPHDLFVIMDCHDNIVVAQRQEITEAEGPGS